MSTFLDADQGTVQGNQLSPKTVFLWGREELLMRAVEHLLVQKHEWHAIRISSEWDEETMALKLKGIFPDVLVVSESVLMDDGYRLIQIVEEYPKLKIITINLENNLIEIYHKQTLGINEASDLLEIIEAVDLNTQGGKTKTLTAVHS
jgi:hypothetical protein